MHLLYALAVHLLDALAVHLLDALAVHLLDTLAVHPGYTALHPECTDDDVIGTDSQTGSAEGRVEHQKLNQTLAFGRCSLQISTYHIIIIASRMQCSVSWMHCQYIQGISASRIHDNVIGTDS